MISTRRQYRTHPYYLLLWKAIVVFSFVASFAVAQSSSSSSKILVRVLEDPSKRKGTYCHENDRVKDGHFVTLHYNVSIDESSEAGSRGLLVDTSLYTDTDAGIDYDEPLMIQIGDEEKAFAHWAYPLVGLCIGDDVVLTVPPELGYGDRGDGEGLVPPGATLKVQVKILGSHADHELSYKRFVAEHRSAKAFQEMDQDGDGKVNYEEMARFLSVPEDYPNRNSFLRQHFELSDYDKDGLVTLEEFKAILLNFQGIDLEPEL